MSEFTSLDPRFQPWAQALLDVANHFGAGARVTSTTRTAAQQSRLRSAYLSGASSIPAAAPGRSLHNFGQAFDLVAVNPEWQQWLGLVWESWGGRWGGRFDDPIHFDTGANIP